MSKYFRTTQMPQIKEAKDLLQKMVEEEKNIAFAGKLAEIRDAIDFLTLTKEWNY